MFSFVEACRYRIKEAPGKKLFLKPSSLKLASDAKTAVLVKNDVDVNPLIRLFTGQLRLSSGKIYRTSTLSPPIGRLANVPASLTPYEAVKFAAKLYDVDFSKMMTTLMVMTDIQDFIDQRISDIPTLYRNRFNHALWLSIRFDTYIFMQNIEIPSDKEYCERLKIFRKNALADSGWVLFTKNIKVASEFCDHGVVFADQGLIPFQTTEAAIEYFKNDQN